ncbi:MAG: metallophosphoesterase [Candidatus Pacearchaeota archaeon]
MKIVAIGDPHGDLEKVKQIPVKDADLILLTGDLGSVEIAREHIKNNAERRKRGLEPLDYGPEKRKEIYYEEYNSTNEILKYLNWFGIPIYTIFGNVELNKKQVQEVSEYVGEKMPDFYDSMTSFENVRVVWEEVIDFDGLKIGGLNYFDGTSESTRKDRPKGEGRDGPEEEDRKAKGKVDSFGKVDVLLCHQPPKGYVDTPKEGLHVGSEVILDYIKKNQPRYVFCGHIHEGEGHAKIGKSDVYNLGVAGYKVIDIEPEKG